MPVRIRFKGYEIECDTPDEAVRVVRGLDLTLKIGGSATANIASETSDETEDTIGKIIATYESEGWRRIADRILYKNGSVVMVFPSGPRKISREILKRAIKAYEESGGDVDKMTDLMGYSSTGSTYICLKAVKVLKDHGLDKEVLEE